MPWYRTGTVACTQNSTAITGTGTAFAANSRVGDALLGPDGKWYEITNVTSDTVLSILPAYQGATAGAGSYAVAPMQGYVKASADQLRSIVSTFGDKLAALGTTGNYETLPTVKGGTGRSDGRAVFSEISVQAPAALFSTQGLYLGWNGEAGYGGAGNFICNRGGGSGGFTWRSVNADNTAGGPIMAYGYDGTLSVPLAVSVPKIVGLTTAISVSQGGTGATDAATGLYNLGGQPKTASLTALSFDTFAANQVPYFASASTTALMTVSPFMRTVLDDTNAAIACDTLGLSAGTYIPKFASSKGATTVNTTIGSGQGLYFGWNESSGGGEANFTCNKGGGGGGFTWRSINTDNSATGPTMSYSYAGSLTVPGTVTQGSDRRLKKNDVEILDGLEKILAVRPVEFDRRATLDDEEYPFHESGVIAQELNEVLPILVTQPSDEIGGDVWRVNYTGLIPYLISAIKELKAELDKLKSTSTTP
ncbi:tail fiber domain-containing protein [Pseudomonas sp. RIT-To-2]|uniref:tail fiber domain-containing protein n=1 Tax=Pseudomonas sp. RIT-To-2 TaxID=3462541 RepID=UPI002413BB6A